MPVATPAATGFRKSHSQIGLKVDYNQSTDTAPNLPLLRKVLAYIDAHPDEWDQFSWGVQTQAWPCGTAFCIAGHAAVMSGAKPIWSRDCPCGCEPLMEEVEMDGRVLQPATAAREVLGLTYNESQSLFSAENDRDIIQRQI